MIDKNQLSIEELQGISGGFAFDCPDIIGPGQIVACYGIIWPFTPENLSNIKQKFK